MCTRPTIAAVVARLLVTVAVLSCIALPVSRGHAAVDTESGQQVYEFYCYQCHGYAGDARTLASTWLDPQPRNFTASDPGELTRAHMISAVSGGRPETAMTGFSSVLTEAEIGAVVDYIRTRFMQGERPALRYHTPENGWERHERYRDAFPFASGEIALDTPWEQLTASQQRGMQLFMQACGPCRGQEGITHIPRILM